MGEWSEITARAQTTDSGDLRVDAVIEEINELIDAVWMNA